MRDYELAKTKVRSIQHIKQDFQEVHSFKTNGTYENLFSQFEKLSGFCSENDDNPSDDDDEDENSIHCKVKVDEG